jgi:hypothetical protein
MDFAHTPRALELQERVRAFMQSHVFPAEHRFEEELAEQTTSGKRWSPLPVIEELKPKARAAGLWNLWLPATDPSGGQAGGAHSEFHAQFSAENGAGLTNVEYAPLAEIMGQIPWAPEIFNCSAPDTGNMETLRRYAAPEHRERWLKPLLAGKLPKVNLPAVPQMTSGTRNVVIFVVLMMAASWPFFAGRNAVDIATLAMIYVMLGLGLNVVVGFAGLLDLGFVGFYAVGAYTYALLFHWAGWTFWEALPLAEPLPLPLADADPLAARDGVPLAEAEQEPVDDADAELACDALPLAQRDSEALRVGEAQGVALAQAQRLAVGEAAPERVAQVLGGTSAVVTAVKPPALPLGLNG